MNIEIIDENGFLDTLRIISSTSGGLSASTRLATVRWSDGEEVDTFIKVFPMANRNREIINESFGYLMAHHINLRQSPRVALIKISVNDIPADPSDAFAQQNGFYYAWACRSIGGENMKKLHFKPPYQNGSPDEFSQYFDALNEWDKFPSLIAFDDCVGNRDRNPGNVIFLKKNDLAIIDHGLIFGGVDWCNNGLTGSDRFRNWMLDHFIEHHNNAPLAIAWQPIIDAAQSHDTLYVTFWNTLKQQILPVFQALIPNVPTVQIAIEILVQYFQYRVSSCVNRYQQLSNYYSSLGAVAP